MYGNNFIKQHSDSVMVWSYQRLGWRKLVLVEINGVVYSNAYQYSSKIAYSLQWLFLCLFGMHWLGIVRFHIFEIKFNLEKWWGSGEGSEPLLSIMKFKNTCILTESIYPHKRCWTHANKTIFARQWHHSLRNNHYGPLYFLLVPISFRCLLPKWWLHLKKNKFIALFTIIFGSLSSPINLKGVGVFHRTRCRIRISWGFCSNEARNQTGKKQNGQNDVSDFWSTATIQHNRLRWCPRRSR